MPDYYEAELEINDFPLNFFFVFFNFYLCNEAGRQKLSVVAEIQMQGNARKMCWEGNNDGTIFFLRIRLIDLADVHFS